MKRIQVLFFLILVAGVSLFFLILKSEYTENICGTKDFQPFCGTKSVSENLSNRAAEGKIIWNTNCAACHKLDKKMTGPALRGIGGKYDSITIQNYLKGRKTAIESKGYDSSCLIFRTLSDKDISKILSYTE